MGDSVEEAQERMAALEKMRAALWEIGSDDSYRRNRYELHDEYTKEIAEIQAMISTGS